MRGLIEITDDLQALDDLLDETGGDITGCEDYVDRLMSELDTEMNMKVDNYAAFITTLKARAEVRKKEADRLAKRAKVDGESVKWLGLKLKHELERRGIKTLDTDRYKVGVVGNGGKQPLDIHGVPTGDYMKEIPASWVPDKDRIREDLESGKSLDFAVLQERGTRLSIR